MHFGRPTRYGAVARTLVVVGPGGHARAGNARLAHAACVSATAAVAIPNPKLDARLATAKGQQTAVFAGGCFWGVEAVFDQVKGVQKAESGYAGGSKDTAEYYTVGSGTTGHAESVRVTYDPSQITYGQLLKVFFSVAHDPTELNRQGPDVGTQYRSAIFYADDEQKKVAEAYIRQLNDSRIFHEPIVTTLEALETFYAAEDYHQDYYKKNPVRYQYYRSACGRDARLKQLWGDRAASH